MWFQKLIIFYIAEIKFTQFSHAAEELLILTELKVFPFPLLMFSPKSGAIVLSQSKETRDK